ncbi:hypothetical protein [Phenylobacterium sp. NIBR 498073]|uniref:hypothetical protein n=1 Tax=Phenylobacterium sp. NIBR 498073 TaxID=3015177 RepID=UPI0022B3E8A9|nr:hypothetical protein [Phenylobacterium sp. NIBR 498073]WGU42084.1 hypothetical protein O4N75_10225 [Phenylobacterium sp. NIBR 498073]
MTDEERVAQDERIARAFAKKDPEFAREQFNRETDERRWMDAAGTFMVALYHRAVALMETEDFGIQWQEPPDDGFGVIVGIVAALSKLVEEQGDSAPFKLLIALEAFSSIARTQAIIEGRDPDCEEEGDRTAKLILAAAAMGHCDTSIALCENGHWDDFGEAKWKLFQMGRTQRGRQAPWEAAFAPRAVSYCEGKQKVTLGQLTNLARVWADEERGAGRNPQLPSTDDGIKAGLKRMEAAGLLSIPGRTEGGAGVGTAE